MRITQKQFMKLISYDPNTGIFTNIVSRGAAASGARAGTKSGPYRYITVFGFKKAEHQWAFLYMRGRFPKNEVDHKNRIKIDNAWNNLREATRVQNLANSCARYSHKLKGTYKLESGRFGARLYYKGKSHALGVFVSEIDANLAYVAKARELHGEFAL